VSNYPEAYLLARYFRRHSTEPVRFVMSVAAAAKTLRKSYTRIWLQPCSSAWGLLPANVKLYVSPMPRQAFLSALEGTLGTLPIRDSGNPQVIPDDLIPGEPTCYLMIFLRASGRIVPPEDAYSGGSRTRFLLLFELSVHPVADQNKSYRKDNGADKDSHKPEANDPANDTAEYQKQR
jgi:hypothetical protein